jgi:hypothetical protein
MRGNTPSPAPKPTVQTSSGIMGFLVRLAWHKKHLSIILSAHKVWHPSFPNSGAATHAGIAGSKLRIPSQLASHTGWVNTCIQA